MLSSTKTCLEDEWHIPAALLQKAEVSERETAHIRAEFRAIVEYNQLKVLSAFREQAIAETHFYGTTGYGFHDAGREALDRLCARIFRAEKALVRWQFVSGTHALSSVLFGVLRPGDLWLSLIGSPYDTLHPVIDGGGQWQGSLKEWGVRYREIPLTAGHDVDLERVGDALAEKPKMAYIQRSLGYTWRPSLSLEKMERIISFIKSRAPGTIVMVDNCYGEFVEVKEPLEAGADVVGGSLIKNLGGGIAPCGGYIAGREAIVDQAAISLTSPGIGPDEGATMGMTRLLMEGLFLAPATVGHAVEGAILASHLLNSLGFPVMPGWQEKRTDIIQAIGLGSPERLKAFCRGIQQSSPVDSFAVPEAVNMPGYRDPIIMAGGTFVQGSSIELSADGPLREPYAVYLQGGLSYHHVKIGVLKALAEMIKENLITV